MNYYFNMLKKCVSRIEADFDFSAEIDHNSSKGTFREIMIKELLRPFLPGEYGISSGQAFDKDWTISKQLDIVLYDTLHSYIAPFSKDYIYFPCESIYGNIEVKSKLNKDSLNEAMLNIQSLKTLKREPINTYYVNPMKPLQIDCKNLKWNITATSEYFGGVFAYESNMCTETIMNHIKSSIEEGTVKREYIPNFIVLFKNRKIIVRYKRCADKMNEIVPLKEFDGLLVLDCKESVLTEFLMLIFVILRSIELKAMDIERMIKELHNDIFNTWDSNKIIESIILLKK